MDTKSVIRQLCFSLAWKHYVVEGNPICVNEDGQCQYTNESGNNCVIGLLIKQFDPESAILVRNPCGSVESLSYSSNEYSGEIPSFILDDIEFFQALQGAHDDSRYLSIAEEFTSFADTWNLVVPS